MRKWDDLNMKKIIDVVHVTEISENTGEVFEYTSPVINPEYLQEQKVYLKREGEFSMIIDEYFGQYFFYFYNALKDIDIPYNMKTRFLYLSSFVQYRTGLLIDTDIPNKTVVLKRKDLEAKMLLCPTEFRRTISALKKANLIIEEKKQFYINADYIIKGEIAKSSIDYARVFINGIKQLYRDCEATYHKKLFYLYALLPNINLKYNCVCENPTEEISENINTLDMKDICDLVGYNPNNAKRLWNEMRSFKLDNKYVIATVIVGDKTFIKINPKVYYRGVTSQLDELKGLMSDFSYNVKKD